MKTMLKNAGAALAVTLLTSLALPHSLTAQGLTTVYFPAETPGPPSYARIDSTPYTDGEWVAVVFYRDPACIPADFNLLQQFDAPRAFGCPLVIQGWGHVPAEGGFPKMAKAWGNAVPVWFLPLESYLAAIQDGSLYIEELAALHGLIMGVATHFNEVIHPRAAPSSGLGGHNVFKLIISASGILEGDRQFKLQITRVEDELRSVQILFK